MPVSPTKHILINSSGGDFPISVFPMTIRDECDTDFTLQVCTSITYFHICFKAQKKQKETLKCRYADEGYRISFRES